MSTIVWFRRDLRLADNPALTAAAEHRGEVVPVYLTDWEAGSSWAPGAASRWWLDWSLRELTRDFSRMGVTLLQVAGDPVAVLPELAREATADRVVWNRLYEPHSLALDQRVGEALQRAGIAWESFPASLLFPPEEHLSRSGRPFVRFGAFWRSCLALPEPRRPLMVPERLLQAVGRSSQVPAESSTADVDGGGGGAGLGFDVLSSVWRPGERGARSRLKRFLEEVLFGYDTTRDLPAVEGVSRLSPHLHFGEMSPYYVWHAVRGAQARRERGGRSSGGAGRRGDDGHAPDRDSAFLQQLGWREFAHYLLFHFPATPTEPFRPEFARFPWFDDAEGLAAWQQGVTGYPLVDAGMRQLLAEGWMHNRIRMVVASFLTKDLLVPWQTGTAWFWDRLVDADLANNTLGWQWTAGSGPDAAPYFRIYNPELQARRFDPRGDYVQRWLGKGEGEHTSASRPRAIVDHGMARLRALAAFDEMRGR
jgi:deoxyribodipyrimidine photo-lyase